jgi:hypothetical protein
VNNDPVNWVDPWGLTASEKNKNTLKTIIDTSLNAMAGTTEGIGELGGRLVETGSKMVTVGNNAWQANPYGAGYSDAVSTIAAGANTRDLGIALQNSAKYTSLVTNGISGAVLAYQIAKGNEREAFGTAFSWGGSFAGAKAGTAIGGTLGGPPGAVVGGIAGSILGNSGFKALGYQAFDMPAPGPQSLETIYQRTSMFLPR